MNRKQAIGYIGIRLSEELDGCLVDIESDGEHFSHRITILWGDGNYRVLKRSIMITDTELFHLDKDGLGIFTDRLINDIERWKQRHETNC